MQTSKLLKTMKLTAFLLFASFLQVAANSKAQNITLSVKNVPMKEVFREIQKQTGMNVVVKESLLDAVGNVSLIVKNLTIKEVLDLSFKNKPITFFITENTIVIKEKIPDNPPPTVVKPEIKTIDITGRILDENRKGVLASITVKGTKYVVPSDENGNFILKGISEDATLIITGVNIETKELKVNGKTNLVIYVKTEITKMEAITVTGYGIERKTKELGYSVAKIKGEEINRANSGNLLTGIIGKISGLIVSTQSADLNPQLRILIRGIRSFGENSNNQPLFVLNGAPISFGVDNAAAGQVMEFINNINPADIEDVTVLKGANGTAIYGPEGVNGVILITTKKGTKGAPVINFRSNTSFQLVDFRRDFRQRKYGLGSGSLDANGNGIYDPRATSNWGPAYDGSLVPIGYPDENGDLQKVSYSDRKDFRRFFDIGITNRTNLSFASADAVSSTYLGLGYVTQTGILPGDKQNQINALLNSSRKYNKLTVQFNVNYSRRSNDIGPNSINTTIRNTPSFIPLHNYKNYETDYWSNRSRYWNYISPYELLATNRTRSTTNAVSSNFIFELKPVHWLTLKVQPSINFTNAESKNTVAPYNFAEFARQDINKFFDRRASVRERSNTSTSLNNDFIVSTIHQAGNFLIRTNVGNTIRQNLTKEIIAAADLLVPVYNLAFSVNQPSAFERTILSRTISVFGNASVGYKDKIFFELTARNEWDSKRAKVARGKDFYASANTSILLKKVFPTLNKIKWLSTLNMRASLAKSANLNISPYQSDRILELSSGYPFYNEQNNTFLLSYGFRNGVPNPLLKPEKVLSQEYGLNIGLFNNRITIDATYYHQTNTAVILEGRTPWLSGYPTTDNAGKFRNNGFELDIKINPLIKLPKNFGLSLELRGAYNNNKVLSLSPIYNGVFPLFDNNGNEFYARTGNSAFEFAVTDWKRNSEGKIIVDKNTGFPIPANFGENTIKGNTLPKYNASMGINFSWKRFSTNILFDYLGGFSHLFPTRADFLFGSDPRTTFNNRQPYVIPNSVYIDATGKSVTNDIPVKNAGQELYQNHAQVSDLGFTSAAAFKLREIAFQYTVPIKNSWIKEFTTSIYGRDLLFAYPSSNIFGDPALTKAPGDRGFQPVQSNTTGGSSEESSVPGSILFGCTLSLKF